MIVRFSGKLMYSFILVVFYVVTVSGQSSGTRLILTADSAVALAMENNATLKALDHTLNAAAMGVKSAFTDMVPTVTLSGSYRRLSGNDMFRQFLGSDLKDSYSFTMDVQQTIFAGFAVLNGFKSARLNRTLQHATNVKTQQTVRYAVLQIYRGLVNLQKSKVVAEEAVRHLETLAENQKAMMGQGMATEHDYLLSNASLAQAKMSALEVGKSIASMTREFAILMGLPVNTTIVLSDTAALRPNRGFVNVDSMVGWAVRNRPDIIENTLKLKLGSCGVQRARAAYYPSLVAGYSYTNQWPDQTFNEEWGNDWYAYVSLNFNLFKWGDRFYKVKKTKEEQEALRVLHEQKKARVEKSVRDAWQTVLQSKKELDVAHLLVDAREKAYKASLAKHSEGVMPMYELLNAHSEFISAQYKELQASTNLELSITDYEMGGLGTSQ